MSPPSGLLINGRTKPENSTKWITLSQRNKLSKLTVSFRRDEIKLLTNQWRGALNGPKHTPGNLGVWPRPWSPCESGSHSATYEGYLWGFWCPCSHNAARGPQCWGLSPYGRCCIGPAASWHLQGPWKSKELKTVSSKIQQLASAVLANRRQDHSLHGAAILVRDGRGGGGGRGETGK